MTRPDFAGMTWRKSRVCGDGGSCVEVAQVGSRVGVRDTNGTILIFNRETWAAFVAQCDSRDNCLH
jgi:Domain of unknown function (DUF397)